MKNATKKQELLRKYTVSVKNGTAERRASKKTLQNWRKYIIPTQAKSQDNTSELVDEIVYGVKQ